MTFFVTFYALYVPGVEVGRLRYFRGSGIIVSVSMAAVSFPFIFIISHAVSYFYDRCLIC